MICATKYNIHDKNFGATSFIKLGKYVLNGYFFDSITKSGI